MRLIKCVYSPALYLCAPNAAEITYGQSWWPSHSNWMIPGTYIGD